jgi:hypothetical protein
MMSAAMRAARPCVRRLWGQGATLHASRPAVAVTTPLSVTQTGVGVGVSSRGMAHASRCVEAPPKGKSNHSLKQRTSKIELVDVKTLDASVSTGSILTWRMAWSGVPCRAVAWCTDSD